MTVKAEDVRYGGAGASMHGRLFRDDQWSDARPGVLVFPEGFGISDHTYKAAERVAGLGYVALACDLYGGGYFHNGPSPETQRRVSEIMAMPKGLLGIGNAAYDCLRSLACVDPARIAAIGYCLGATVAMELAFSGAPIRGVAGFHPSFTGLSLEDAGRTRGHIHLFIGAEDYAAPPQARAEVEQALAGKGVKWRMTIYGSVKHSFTNPNCAGMGDKVAYDAEADQHSFEAMRALFEQTLRLPA
jgi:dienelactone hydrolase